MFSAFFKKNLFEIQANVSNVKRYLEEKNKQKNYFNVKVNLNLFRFLVKFGDSTLPKDQN